MRLEKRRRDLKLYTHVLYGPWYHDHLLSPTIFEEFCEQSYKHCLGSLAGIIFIDLFLGFLGFRVVGGVGVVRVSDVLGFIGSFRCRGLIFIDLLYTRWQACQGLRV